MFGGLSTYGVILNTKSELDREENNGHIIKVSSDNSVEKTTGVN